MLTIGLSGPQGKLKQVHKALEDAGFILTLDKGGQPTLDHDLSDMPKGHLHVTVEGDDMNRAHAVVAPFGWRLRSHWCNEDAGLAYATGGLDNISNADRLKRIEHDLAILKGVG